MYSSSLKNKENASENGKVNEKAVQEEAVPRGPAVYSKFCPT